jgi:DNA-binding transcriptional LysR family regulator
MRDSLDGVAVFVEAVEAGGFARAAERLALTRSAVGKTIARMEARLGVRLFHRTTRSQSLTEDGQIYYERCLRALEELRAGEALLESGRREVSGRLKVSMPVLFGRYCVEPVLLELAQEHAKLELDLRFSDSVVDLIAEGFDLAIRNRVPGEGNGLRARKIASQRKVVCAAPSYVATQGAPTDVAALASHDALVYWRNDQPFPWTLRDRNGEMIEAQLKWRLRFDSQEAIVDAAVSGMGIACVPSWLVRSHIDAGDLVPLLEPFPSIPLDTYAVWPAARHMPMRLRVTIDTLAARLRGVVDL